MYSSRFWYYIVIAVCKLLIAKYKGYCDKSFVEYKWSEIFYRFHKKFALKLFQEILSTIY